MYRLSRPEDGEADGRPAPVRHLRVLTTPRFGGPWRIVLPSMFVAVWLGFALLPETHAYFRTPGAVALAVIVGIGSQLCGQGSWPSRRARFTTAWIVPGGAVLAMVAWLSSLPERPGILPPLGSALILGLVGLQILELRSPSRFSAAVHATNIGAGFALAFAAYALSASTPGVVAGALCLIATAASATVVLRGESELEREALEYAAVVALAVVEVAWMLYGSRPPLVYAAALLLTLYATSGICHAMLDRAPARAYVEVAAVTIVSLSALLIAGGRA